MTSIVAIDESGNLGSEYRYFTMSAIIARRVRDLKPAFKTIDSTKAKRKTAKSVYEVKFSNSYKDEREEILVSIASCPMQIVYVCIDKYSKEYANVRGKILYKEAIGLLLPLVNDALETKDVILHFDQNLSVSANELTEIVKSNLDGRNVKAVKKVQSYDNKCVQLADFTAGSIRQRYESGEGHYIELIKEKISFAYEP